MAINTNYCKSRKILFFMFPGNILVGLTQDGHQPACYINHIGSMNQSINQVKGQKEGGGKTEKEKKRTTQPPPFTTPRGFYSLPLHACIGRRSPSRIKGIVASRTRGWGNVRHCQSQLAWLCSCPPAGLGQQSIGKRVCVTPCLRIGYVMFMDRHATRCGLGLGDASGNDGGQA